LNSLKLLLITVCGLCSCTLNSELPVTVIVLEPTTAPTSAATVPPAPTTPPEILTTPVTPDAPGPTPTENPYPWTDEIPTMFGICFEAAMDAADQVFVLRDAEEHIRFYDLADNSQLCRRPVRRNPFDFGNGDRVLAGLWSTGIGCVARHDVIDYRIDGDTLSLVLQFVTEGDCNYELVRPYWIGVDGVSNVEIVVEAAP
jgi:hypothetical protein